jgi:hypothetical protein
MGWKSYLNAKQLPMALAVQGLHVMEADMKIHPQVRRSARGQRHVQGHALLGPVGH